MWEAFVAFHICIACSLPELLRRPVVERAVRALAVVLAPPVRQSVSYVVECAEPAGVQTLIAQSPVEALDVPVLHRPAGLDVYQPDLPVLGPAQHAPRSELRAVVQAQDLRPATFSDQPLQHPGHASRTEAGIGLQRKALARVGIDHAQDADHPPGCQAVDDEVHRPLLVGTDQTRFLRSIPHQPLALPAPDSQTFLDIEPVDTLLVHLVTATTQQRMQPSVAVARLLPRQLHQLLAQCDVAVGSRLISVARPLHTQQLAGRAFAQPELDRDERNFFS